MKTKLVVRHDSLSLRVTDEHNRPVDLLISRKGAQLSTPDRTIPADIIRDLFESFGKIAKSAATYGGMMKTLKEKADKAADFEAYVAALAKMANVLETLTAPPTAPPAAPLPAAS